MNASFGRSGPQPADREMPPCPADHLEVLFFPIQPPDDRRKLLLTLRLDSVDQIAAVLLCQQRVVAIVTRPHAAAGGIDKVQRLLLPLPRHPLPDGGGAFEEARAGPFGTPFGHVDTAENDIEDGIVFLGHSNPSLRKRGWWLGQVLRISNSISAFTASR